MKISEFLKDKTLEIIFAIFLIITIIAFLSVTQVDLFIKMYIPIAILLFFIILLINFVASSIFSDHSCGV